MMTFRAALPLFVLLFVGLNTGCTGDANIALDEAQTSVEGDETPVPPPNRVCSLDEPTTEVACPEEPAEICAKIGWECGGTFAEIGCGGVIDSVDCGGCPDGFACNEGSCACPVEAECGVVESACGGSVSCGSCGDGFACVDNRCECNREPDEVICERLEVACGGVLAEDFCGNDVVAECGGCGSGVCGGNTCHDFVELERGLEEGEAEARFGFRVDAADTRVLVAAPWAVRDGVVDAGRVDVYERGLDGAFTSVGTLETPAVEGELLGVRVAISPDGGFAAAATGSGAGVRLFRWDDGRMVPAGTIESPVDGIEFARSLVAGEELIAIGSVPQGETGAGRVDLYDWNGTPQGTIEPPDQPGVAESFGQSVALSEAGVWVGADLADRDGMTAVGVVYRFETPDASPEAFWPSDAAAGQRFGHRLTFTSDSLLVGSHFDADKGSVYVITFEGGGWNEIQQLHAPEPTAGARFGHALAGRGKYLFVGSYGADGGYLFELDLDYRWKLVRTLESPAADGEWFGFRGAVAEGLVFVAAPRASGDGRVYAFGVE